MCGIFAYISNEPESVTDNEKFIKKQFEKGKSRGPESSEFVATRYLNDTTTNIYLGFHRLAINGLTPEGNQPFFIDGIYLICNGEIYNWKSFNLDLITGSDCEVIVHLYRKYGIEYLFELLDGVFSFVLYDTNISKIYAARDPYGVRPMYYYTNRSMIFASEIKQISKFGINIKHFPPGSFMEYDLKSNSIVTLKKYSSFGFTKMIYSDLNDIYTYIYYGLLAAVRKRVVGTTERNIACLLSGGLDSSTIAAMVNSFLPPGTLETYSIGLKDSTDLVYAQQVADHLGTKHTSIILTESEFFDAIPEVIKAIESYDTTSVRASVGNYLIGKYIAAHSQAKVIFNGDDADELMGGYLYFKKSPSSVEFDCECKRLLSDIHYFDVLRSDRCISCHGLEPRTPFLDRSFVQLYLSIPHQLRFQSNIKGDIEKYILRIAIETNSNNLLPTSVLWRTKEAFSDGVSGLDRSWYQIIQERVQNLQLVKIQHIHNCPQTLEQMYYRSIFENEYPGCSDILEYLWMPRFTTGATDPSARTLVDYQV